MSGCPVAGIGLARAREVKEVLGRAREEHRQRQRDHVGPRTVCEIELDRHAAALGRIVGHPGIPAAVREAHGRAHRLALHVRGASERGGLRRRRERARAERALRVRGAVSGVHAGDSLIESTTCFRRWVGHRADPNADQPTASNAEPRYSPRDHRAASTRTSTCCPTERTAGADALAAPGAARRRHPGRHHGGGRTGRPARRRRCSAS